MHLLNNKDDLVPFMMDVDIPSTNNQDVKQYRIKKVRPKIFGRLRNFMGAELYCHIKVNISFCKNKIISFNSNLQLNFRDKYQEFI